MARLGYARYGAQSGDWGAAGQLHRCRAGAAATAHHQHRGARNGYFEVRATRPQTLAYALSDSPVGQLAWIMERFKEWAWAAEVPEVAVDRDQLLTNVMLYWLTGTAGSSAELYYENSHTGFSGPAARHDADRGGGVRRRLRRPPLR
jgi:hypothetical protein